MMMHWHPDHGYQSWYRAVYDILRLIASEGRFGCAWKERCHHCANEMLLETATWTWVNRSAKSSGRAGPTWPYVEAQFNGSVDSMKILLLSVTRWNGKLA